jgi:hypothetical protein
MCQTGYNSPSQYLTYNTALQLNQHKHLLPFAAYTRDFQSFISFVFFQRLCANYQTYVTWKERITHFSSTVYNKSERGLFRGSLTVPVWRYCRKSEHVSRIHERPRRKYICRISPCSAVSLLVTLQPVLFFSFNNSTHRVNCPRISQRHRNDHT